jgi:AAA+ superfamily predicted ATPase
VPWYTVCEKTALSEPPNRTLEDDVWSEEVRTALEPLLATANSVVGQDERPRTVLITGATNAGKSYLAGSIAGELGNPISKVSDTGSELDSDFVDDIESNKPCTVLYDTLLLLERQTVEPERIDSSAALIVE